MLERALADNPDNLETRYQLCAVKTTRDEYEAALQQLLEIARHDGNFRDQIGRNGLYAIFGLLGENDARAQRYRAPLSQVMH